MDQIYRNLLLHLQHPSGSSLHKGIPPTLAHYLSILPLPLPTTLTASAIASLTWTPSNISSLLLAFRNAVHRKADILLAPTTTTTGAGTSTTGSSSLLSLSPGPSWGFRKWIRALCLGAGNGQAFVRLAALGGVLMGLEDVKDRLMAGGARWKVEDEVVVAFAEYLEAENDSWVREVRGQEKVDKDEMLYIASYVLPLVSESKFRVLDLSSIISQCMVYITETFQDARFLQPKPPAAGDTYKETIQNHLPHIARLASRSVDVLSDNPGAQEVDLLCEKIQEILDEFHAIATTAENTWIVGGMVTPADNASGKYHYNLYGIRRLTRILDAANGTENTAWTQLKSLLFTAVMLLQSITDSILYNPLPENSNPTFASRVLETFSHLSFISTKFGGVVARGEGSFREYQRAFYTALDIIAAGPPCGEDMIVRLGRQRRELVDKELTEGHPVLLAATAFYLAVVEQLVDQISTIVMLEEVLPICQVYLDKPLHREAFESSHSVVLALFASLGRHKQVVAKSGDTKREEIVRLIVPFYASSLISCSADGMLNTTQLRLAFSSLVAGAGAGLESTETNGQNSDGAALVWYCIDCLLSEITASHQRTLPQDANSPDEQYDRLVLMLVSVIAAIPPSPSLAPLLPRVLDAVEEIVKSEEDAKRKEMVVKAVYEEILRSVGDGTREVVLRWWFDAFRPGVRSAGVEVGAPSIRSEL